MTSASGHSAFQPVLGSNPVDIYGWDDQDGNLLFAQDTSVSGQCVERRALRMIAQESALVEVPDLPSGPQQGLQLRRF